MKSLSVLSTLLSLLLNKMGYIITLDSRRKNLLNPNSIDCYQDQYNNQYHHLSKDCFSRRNGGLSVSIIIFVGRTNLLLRGGTFFITVCLPAMWVIIVNRCLIFCLTFFFRKTLFSNVQLMNSSVSFSIWLRFLFKNQPIWAR